MEWGHSVGRRGAQPPFQAALISRCCPPEGPAESRLRAELPAPHVRSTPLVNQDELWTFLGFVSDTTAVRNIVSGPELHRAAEWIELSLGWGPGSAIVLN